jgi:glycerol uptake facilitator protein
LDSIFVSELVGTGILILLGDGVVANVLLRQSKAEGAGWMVITTGWGIAVAIGVYAGFRFSGAHINPAVTLGLASGGLVEWGDVPLYIAGQFVGAFLGAVMVWLAFLPHWGVTDDPDLKLGVFSTAPAIRKPALNLVTEAIGTFILLVGVLAIVNSTAQVAEDAVPIGLGINPFLIGVLVWGIGLSLGGPTGYAINPARDLAPRIAHAVLPIPGKRDSDWGYAWVPVVGPIIGGILGVWLAVSIGLTS